MKKMIYLANSYSSFLRDKDAAALQRHSRRALESYIGGQLKKKYDVTIILPIAISAAMVDLCSFDSGFAQWADDDFNFISRSDEVWVLLSEGWKESIGVQAEIQFALNRGIPVRYVNAEKCLLIEDVYVD